MTHLLVSLTAPGSVIAEIGKLQQEVFRSTGFLSAIAFAPTIPIAFVSGFEGLDAAALARRCPRGAVCSTAEMEAADGGLYLRVDTQGIWAAVRALVPCVDGPFAVHEGFVLGCWEGLGPTPPEADVPPQRFSSCTLDFVHLTVSDSAAWWREVYTETVQSRPLR